MIMYQKVNIYNSNIYKTIINLILSYDIIIIIQDLSFHIKQDVISLFLFNTNLIPFTQIIQQNLNKH